MRVPTTRCSNDAKATGSRLRLRLHRTTLGHSVAASKQAPTHPQSMQAKEAELQMRLGPGKGFKQVGGRQLAGKARGERRLVHGPGPHATQLPHAATPNQQQASSQIQNTN